MNGIMLAFICGLFIGLIVAFNWGRVYERDQIESPEQPHNRTTGCACTIFDDGSSFVLLTFAGGGSPRGSFSYVRCMETRPDGSAEVYSYIRE